MTFGEQYLADAEANAFLKLWACRLSIVLLITAYLCGDQLGVLTAGFFLLYNK